jgi:hypothetical protein
MIDGEQYGFCPVGLIAPKTLRLVAEAMEVRMLHALPRPGGLNNQYNRDVEVIAYVLSRLKSSGEW